MKFFLVALLTLLFANTPSLLAQETPLPVLHLSFDESVTDLSGLNPEIDVQGGRFVEDRNGNPNSAFYFDGVDDAITIADTDNALDGITELSFMSWVKYEGFDEESYYATILERFDSYDTEGYFFGMNRDGYLEVEGYTAGAGLEANEWSHIAFVIGEGRIKFYFNGKLIDEASTLNEKYLANNSDITIGISEFSNSPFQGSLDEVKIYDYAADENVIRINAGLEPIVKVQDRIFYMPFSGAIADSSKYEHEVFEDPETGKADGTFIEDRFGGQDKAYRFKGTDNAIQVHDSELYRYLNFYNSFTIALWLYVESYPEENSVIMQLPYHYNGTSIGFSMELDNSGMLNFYTKTGDLYSKNNRSEFPQRQWVHVAITYNGENSEVFINGEKDINTIDTRPSFPVDCCGHEKRLYIGNNYSNTEGFNESIDDISIYNYELSDSEIKSIVDYEYSFNSPENSLLISFPFDTSLEDESDIENNITVTGGNLASDRFGNTQQAYKFNQADYITIADTDNRLDSLYTEVTFSTWVRADNLSENGTHAKNILLSRTDQENADKLKFWLYKNPDFRNQIYFSVNSKVVSVNSLDVVEGNWIHVAGTYDGNTLKIFLNGELIRSENYETTLSLTDSDLHIGGKPSYLKNEKGFDGVMDDIRLYNYALPDSAIKSSYDLEIGRRFEKQEIAYLPFNGSAIDSSHNRNNTEVIGAQLSGGRFDQEETAYTFNDDTDVIKIKDDSAELDSIYAGLTIHTWIKFDEDSDMSIVHRKDSSQYGQFYLGMSGTKVRFKINNAEIYYYHYKLNRGKWYLISATFEDSKMKLFIDGQLASEGGYSGRLEMGESDILIGNNNDLSQPFRGSIDEVGIYNYALEEEIIQAFYENRFKGYDLPPQNMLHLSFSNTLVDSSETDHPVISEGGSFTEDRLDNPESAYSFDGENDRLIIKDSNSALDSIGTGFTMAAWVNMKGGGVNYPQSSLISRMDSEFDSFYLGIVDGKSDYWGDDPQNAEGILFRIDDEEIAFKDKPIQTGSWFHVAGTFEDEMMKLYINGEMVKTASYTGIITVSESDLFIGNTATGDQPFYGDLDDIRVYNYALSDSAIADFIDIETVVVPNEPAPEKPDSFKLSQNYPNPFNPTTQIEFSIPVAGDVSLKIFNTIGHEVATLKSGRLNSGYHSVTFDASQISSGVYFYQLRFKEQTLIKKMLLIK
ncbi:MAG: LamG-like jellyroll fold domain-containing protein [Balneolaceae bacterium]